MHRRRFTMRRPGYAMCASIMAVVLATSGTALAARVATKAKPKPKPVAVTGVNVKNESLTGVDFKDGSISTRQIHANALRQIRTLPYLLGIDGMNGANGAKGALGDVGEDGSIGAKGARGIQGPPAPRAYTFQTTARLDRVLDDEPNPATTPTGTYCTTGTIPNDDRPIGCALDGSGGNPIRYPRWNYRCNHLGDGLSSIHCRTTDRSVPRLTRSLQSLIVTSNNASGGLLVMHTTGTIVLNASATFYTQRTRVNQRLECQLQVARVENGVTQAPINVGVPATVQRHVNPTTAGNYRNERERLITISATGAVAQEAGVYETILACRAPDDTGHPNDRLEFIEGNLSVLSTRTNGSIGS